MQVIKQSEALAERRRVYLHLVDAADGITPETGEAGGQPQISKNGAAFVNTTATLVAVGNGAYYVELTATEVDTLGWLLVRYKSANTAEFQTLVQIVPYDPYNGATLGLSRLDSIQADTDDIQSRLPAALVGGRMDAHVGSVAADVITDAAVAPDLDVYGARVWLIDDDVAATDRYTVVFYRNGEPLTSGVTGPTIRVIKAADGTDLIPQTALTPVGATGYYRHDEATARIVAGAAYLVEVRATIGGGPRAWVQPVGRDSAP